MRRLLGAAVSLGLLLVSALAGVSVAPLAAATTSGLKIVPALRNWAPGGTGFTFAAGARVVAGDQSLTETAQTFAGELKTLTGVDVPVASGTAGDGDIELRLGSAPGGREGYRMTAAPKLRVEGNTAAGVFYGTRSILQLIRQARTIPGGTGTDWPLYAERGLMVDVGRQYLSLPWLKARIRELGYLKLNQLHLHLSDTLGMRLESTSHPEVTSPQHYTKQQIRDLIAYAARYQIQIVPELDFPGHMDAILRNHPELKLRNTSGVVNDSFIDLSKPASYDLMKDLINEYLPLFGGKYWAVGADEYVTNYADYPQLEAYAKEKYGPNATGKDAYYGFINWANDLVRAGGKTARVWNDGLKPGGATLTINPNISIGHWSMSGPLGLPWIGDAYTPQQLVDMGHRVINMAHRPLTYTTGGPGAADNTHPLEMYDTWDPNIWVNRSSVSDLSKVDGATFQLWCDDPSKSEQELDTVLHHRLRVLSQHTWRSPGPALYALFVPVMDAIGEAP